jgi:hypothetical protein
VSVVVAIAVCRPFAVFVGIISSVRCDWFI